MVGITSMTRPIPRRLAWGLVFSLAALAASCGDSTPTPTSPGTPSSTTETFTGTLTRNGAQTHQFGASAAGLITATLTTLTPDSSAVVGLSLGTWNALSNVCQNILANDSATQGTVLTGNVSTTSALCVRIADSTGALPQPESYTITVSHP